MPQAGMRESYISAFSMLDILVDKYELSKYPPGELYHYSSITSCLNIVNSLSLRVAHCEYMNDTDEIKHALRMIDDELEKLINNSYTLTDEKAFYREVLKDLHSRYSRYEAFVFCMSEGDPTRGSRYQDVLSMWRAYGRNGKGTCLSINNSSFSQLSQRSSVRLSRVVYESAKQQLIISELIHMGWKQSRTGSPANDAIEATVVALVFLMPVMKNQHFSEEREWRLIYVPEPTERAHPTRKAYENSSGLLVPYFELGTTDDIAVAVSEIMVGPSPWQELNVNTLNSLTSRILISNSHIPYRT